MLFCFDNRVLAEFLLIVAVLVRMEARFEAIEGLRPRPAQTTVTLSSQRTNGLDQWTRSSPEEGGEDDEVSFDMTSARLESHYGWDNVTIRLRNHTYIRNRCFGGPPAFEDTWEYQVLDGAVIFHRLKESNADDIYVGKQFDVLEGDLNYMHFEARNAEHREKSGPLDLTPYDEETISGLRKQVTWHELHGAIKYLILRTARPDLIDRTLQKLNESFEKIASDAAALGAALDEYGQYELPPEADEASHAKLREMFSTRSLRTKYSLRSFQDWSEREWIVKLSERQNEANASSSLVS